MIGTAGFEFNVDKANNAIYIMREFNAELPLVWDAFTKAEILDQWYAPAPWMSVTKEMNFEVGGRRLYAMKSPEGMEHWGIQEYTSITPKTNFIMLTNFSDSDGNITSGFKSSENDLNFSEDNGKTRVNITIKYASSEVLEMIIAKGFKEGYSICLENLENLLEKQSAK